MVPTPELDEMVGELVAPYVERVRVSQVRAGTVYGHEHQVPVPALLGQLRGRAQVRGEGVRGGFGSAEPVSVEAVDTAARIDLEAARWVRDLGEDDAGDTEWCLLELQKLAASAAQCQRTKAAWGEDGEVSCCTWHAIEADVRRWWLSARVVSGWDGRPWSPDASCPVCDERGGLRIRLADSSALCVKCRALWDSSSIGVLAEHVRWSA